MTGPEAVAPGPGAGEAAATRPPIQVWGGAGGLDVRYDDLAATAGALDASARRLRSLCVEGHRVALDPQLAVSAALDADGYARAQAMLLAALDGPTGLGAAVGHLVLRAAALQAAVLRYRVADRVDASLTDARRWATGAFAPVVAPAAVATIAVAGASFAAARAATGHDAAGDLQTLVVAHPGIADEFAGAAPGAISMLALAAAALDPPAAAVLRLEHGTTLLPTSVAEAAALLGLLYPPTSVVVTARGTDTEADSAGPPRGVGDLVSGLARRDTRSQRQRQGEVDVRVLTTRGADGRVRRSYVVDVPGTKDWQLDPRGSRDSLNDLQTNLAAMAGDPDARTAGVVRAIAAAGAGPGEPIMLVGHSQGGIVALRAAQQLATSGRFHVSHVLTVGAPVAHLTVPPSVQVLSLENRWDLVPRLDARASPDERRRTTVEFRLQSGTVAGNHSLTGAYLSAARELDRVPWSEQPSVAAWRRGAAAFLPRAGDPVQVRTEVYDIRNEKGNEPTDASRHDGGAP